MPIKHSDALVAIGAACAIFDPAGRVLLVHHAYGRLNWELPGGAAEPGESPVDTAKRELFEETGLRAGIERLTGVYYEPGNDGVAALHFVFRCDWTDELEPSAASSEVSEVRFWSCDDLPTPISDFTEQRVRDAQSQVLTRMMRIESRRWRD